MWSKITKRLIKSYIHLHLLQGCRRPHPWEVSLGYDWRLHHG